MPVPDHGTAPQVEQGIFAQIFEIDCISKFHTIFGYCETLKNH